MNETMHMDLRVEQPPSIALTTGDPRQEAIQLREAVEVIIHREGAVHYDTRAAWDMQPTLIAGRGEIYIYSDKTTYVDDVGNPITVPGVKIGDGTSYLIDMPFVADDILFALAQHERDAVSHISAAERLFWNNKVSAFLDENDNENLIISKLYFTED